MKTCRMCKHYKVYNIEDWETTMCERTGRTVFFPDVWKPFCMKYEYIWEGKFYKKEWEK